MPKPIAKLFLSNHCPHCQDVLANIDAVRKNFSDLGYLVKLMIYEEEEETFFTIGIDAVPTLMLPFQRPWEGISPAWLKDIEKLRRMVEGEVSPESIKHKQAKDREKKAIPLNEKYNLAQRT